jgi:uncharacterized protein HemY
MKWVAMTVGLILMFLAVSIFLATTRELLCGRIRHKKAKSQYRMYLTTFVAGVLLTANVFLSA